MNANLVDDAFRELDLAEREALKNLARYKFWMFGYFAARWVFLNRLLKAKRPNPFKSIVLGARVQLAGYADEPAAVAKRDEIEAWRRRGEARGDIVPPLRS